MALDSVNHDQLNPSEVPSTAAVASDERMSLEVVLEALAEDLNDRQLREAVDRLKGELAKGKSLDVAIQNIQGSAPRYLAGMLRAATTSQQLSAVCSSFAQLRDSSERAWRTLQSLLLYPLVMLVVLTSVTMLLSFVLLPHFSSMYEEFGLALPVSTQSILNGLPLMPWVMIGAMVLWLSAILLPGIFGVGYTLRNSLPLLGRMFSSISQQQLAATLASFVELRLPLADALRYTGDLLDDRGLARATYRVAEQVEHGQSLAAAMSCSRAFDRSLSTIAGWGEQRSQLATSLRLAAEMFANRRQQRLVLIRRVVPPLALVAVASSIAVVAASLLTPLISLMSGLAG